MGSWDLVGTARYVSMAGAMTAIGGDVSAIKDNPAALGIFRTNELSVTLDETISRTTSTNITESLNHFQLPQISWVFSKTKHNKLTGMVSYNFMIGFHRLRTYYQTTSAIGWMPISQTDQMADVTNGLTMEDFTDEDGLPWSNTKIGWLSCYGQQNGLIIADGDKWHSILNAGEKAKGNLCINESGTSNEFAFNWGANFSNKWYIGIGINMLTQKYEKDVYYGETFEKGGSYKILSTFDEDHISVNGTFGFIGHPVRCFRFGASFVTPSAPTIIGYKTACSYGENEFRNDYNDYDKLYTQPMRLTAGFAFQIHSFGLVSFEYDYAHQIMRVADNYPVFSDDAHWLKFGTEWVAGKHWFLHAGYAYNCFVPTQEEPFFPGVISTRTDTEFLSDIQSQYASAGVGFHNASWVADLAYQCKITTAELWPFMMAETPFDYTNITHRIVLTLAFRYTK